MQPYLCSCLLVAWLSLIPHTHAEALQSGFCHIELESQCAAYHCLPVAPTDFSASARIASRLQEVVLSAALLLLLTGLDGRSAHHTSVQAREIHCAVHLLLNSLAAPARKRPLGTHAPMSVQ